MTQWFRGQLEGHYVGTSGGKPAVSQFGSASRFKLRVYRALIRNIEVLEQPEGASSGKDGELPIDAPIELPDDCFYQAQIEDARLIGIRPRSCFDGPIYDVAISKLEVTHSTKQGDKTYGRLVGEVYGRYLLPPEVEAEEAALIVKELSSSEEPIAPGSEAALVDSEAEHRSKRSERDIKPLHAPTPPSEDEATPAKVPIPLLVAFVAIVLGLSVGSQPAMFWLGFFVPIMVIRFVVSDLFNVSRGQQVFGALLILAQAVCIGMILLEWWTTGCKVMVPWALVGVGVATLLASLLPSPLPLVWAGAGLGLVLFLWYGDVGTACDSPATPAQVQPAERPRVDDPGVSRTNEDGSWPRRPPRPAPRKSP